MTGDCDEVSNSVLAAVTMLIAQVEMVALAVAVMVLVVVALVVELL